jgi:hypothetical protein
MLRLAPGRVGKGDITHGNGRPQREREADMPAKCQVPLGDLLHHSGDFILVVIEVQISQEDGDDQDGKNSS